MCFCVEKSHFLKCSLYSVLAVDTASQQHIFLKSQENTICMQAVFLAPILLICIEERQHKKQFFHNKAVLGESKIKVVFFFCCQTGWSAESAVALLKNTPYIHETVTPYYKYIYIHKFMLIKLDGRIMLRIMYNWTSLNNTCCQSIFSKRRERAYQVTSSTHAANYVNMIY